MDADEPKPKFRPGEKQDINNKETDTNQSITAAQVDENDEIEVFLNTKNKLGANSPFYATVIRKIEKTPMLRNGTKGKRQVSLIVEKDGEKISLGGGTTVKKVQTPSTG